MRTRLGRMRALLAAFALAALVMAGNTATVSADLHGGPWPRINPPGALAQ